MTTATTPRAARSAAADDIARNIAGTVRSQAATHVVDAYVEQEIERHMGNQHIWNETDATVEAPSIGMVIRRLRANGITVTSL